MRLLLTILPILLLSAAASSALANQILDVAERYAKQQTQGLPGEVSITMGQLGPTTHLAPCERLEGFTPAGSRLWGKSHIGVRCLAPTPWSILISTHIRVIGPYLSTARPITSGQTLQAADIAQTSGDLTSLPNGLISDPNQAIGKIAKNSLTANQPLRSDLLLAPLVIRQGQNVRIISRGAGFAVSSEGKAINNASEGQVAQIRMPSGQIISGVAKPDGTAEISH